MDLHRPAGTADWEKLTPSSYNYWQRIAAGSHGIITPGNVITIVGFVGTVFSLFLLAKHYYLATFVVIAAARLCDILDGWVANSTGTKSKLGANLDAGFDKLATVIIPVGFIILNILPIWAALSLLLPHLVIAYIGYVGLRRRSKLLPSQLGKLSMAAAWISLLGFVALAGLGQPIGLRLAVYAVVVLSVTMSSYAALGYWQTVFKKS